MSAANSGADPAGDDWLSQRERGSLFAIRVGFRLATLFGRRAVQPLVALIALWYRLLDRRAVAASRDWLRRVHAREPGFWDVYRHLHTFAQVTLDRVFLLTGRTRALSVTHHGSEHLLAQQATGRGAVLLGAHLGSFEAMRAGGDKHAGMQIEVLGYFENARMINALFERLNPDRAAHVIHLGHDPVGAMTRARERLERGAMVALLGDRVGLNERVVQATFFGEPARFASGPFLLASVLRCPVYLVFGLYRGAGRYDLHCEPFAERIELPRAERREALAAWVQRYAERVESYARGAPDNWFNFFDFWSPA